MILLFLSVSSHVYANELRMAEGATLSYAGATIGTATGGQELWNATIRVLVLNQSALIFESSPLTENSTQAPNVKITYQNGIPTYADYLTALIYLPSECMTASMQGNLQWTTNLETLAETSTIVDESELTSNFTVGAGTFQSINITLVLAGLDSGTLSLLYDIRSGILIYEQWIPAYGDIVVLALLEATSSLDTSLIMLSMVLFVATATPPVVIAFNGTRKTLMKRKRKRSQKAEETVKKGPSKKPLYLLVSGALLSLSSIFLPWIQPAGLQIYLPLSLASTLAESPSSFTSSANFLAVSLMVHAATITAWLAVATALYSTKRLAAKMMTITSAILALGSVVLFVQSGWILSWGLPVAAIGEILILTSIIPSRIKTAIPPAKPKTS